MVRADRLHEAQADDIEECAAFGVGAQRRRAFRHRAEAFHVAKLVLGAAPLLGADPSAPSFPS